MTRKPLPFLFIMPVKKSSKRISAKQVVLTEKTHHQIVYLPIDSLIPAEYNPRAISDHDMAHLKKSLTEFDAVQPAVVNMFAGRERVIVGGHQRVKAAIELGWTEFPCVTVKLPIAKEKELNIRLNRNAGEWDWQIITKEFTSDQLFDFGFHHVDKLEDFFPQILDEKDVDKGDFTSGPDENAGNVIVLSGNKEELYFPSNAPYSIPELLPELLAPIPEPIVCWAGADISEPCENYFWSYNTDSTRGADWKKFIVGFYTDDKRFEKAWTEPPYVARKILNRQPIACVCPNFSLWSEMPKAVKIWSSYRSRWVGRYWQEAGIKVIPDIQSSDLSSLEYCLAGIPTNAPALSMQIQTGDKSLAEVTMRKQIAAEIIKRLKPQSMLIYGLAEHYEQLFLPIKPKQLHVVFVESRIALRNKVMRREKAAGDKLAA